MAHGIINVLLLEDKPEFARTVQDVLAEAGHAQFRVTHVEGLAEAKGLLVKGGMDVIVSDLSLRETHGIATLIKIKKFDQGLPVIILTGFSDNDLTMRAMEIGAQDYLVKSGENLNRLGTTIRFAIERQQILEKVKEKHRREKEELESALVSRKAFVDWEDSSITAQMAGVGPLRERAPQVFSGFQSDYESLLVEYLESLALNQALPRRKIIELVERIGDQNSNPRDVVEIHLNAVASKSQGKSPSVARTFTVEGRLMLVEILGHLADYYRRERMGT